MYPLIFLIVLCTGCRSSYESILLTPEHPAHADAMVTEAAISEVFSSAPSSLFTIDHEMDDKKHQHGEASMTDHSMHAHDEPEKKMGMMDHLHDAQASAGMMNHSMQHMAANKQNKGTLPESAVKLLDKISLAQVNLSSHVHQNDLSGTIEEAALIEANLAALERVDVPGNVHIWHVNAGPIGELRHIANKVASLKDLTHGHHLSTALKQAIADLFTSLNYEIETPDTDSGHAHHGGHR